MTARTGAACAILAAVPIAGAVGAAASHGVSEHVSQGAINGNGATAAFFAGASADGERVFFTTSEVLAETDTDAAVDVYERAGGVTSHVSQGTINGNTSATVSFLDASADGSRVVFGTNEQLVVEDTDGAFDIYQRSAGRTAMISGGAENVTPVFAGASVDGSRVLFKTAEGLVAGDTDLRVDVYESVEGRIALLTPRGQETAEDALYGGISDDGRHMFWTTFEEVLGSDDEETGAALDVYETFGGTTSHVSIGSNAVRGASWAGNSADGARVFFHSDERYDLAGDTDGQQDIYERAAGTTRLISRGAINGNGAQAARFADASADGSRVLFMSFEALAPTDTDGEQDVYERAGGTTVHASQGAINGNGPHPVFFAGASVDGDRVAFTTAERLTASDTDGAIDVYERVGGSTVHVSQGEVNGNGSNHVTYGGMSADGTRVIFTTSERLAATDTDDLLDVYERSAGVTSHISRGSHGDGTGFVIIPRISLDGSHVFFTTSERLAATDTDAQFDVYEAAEIASNRAPAADPDGYTHHGTDTALVVAAPGVLDGDGDADGDPLTAHLIDLPSHGRLTIGADGSFTYAPFADFVGEDAFTYRASDGQSTSEAATVTITVTAGCTRLAATIAGTEAGETLHGTPGADVIAGLGGDDKINAGDGDDVICGGGGDDVLNAETGDDHVAGDAGDDALRGDLGDDTLLGGAGADSLLGDDGNDRLGGGDGSPDTCRGGAGIDLLTAGHGCESFTGMP